MQVWVLVAGLAFLMVIGSILWIMPSKRDRRIARLRQAAILKGIKVKLIKYPLINLSGRVEEGAIDAAGYSFSLEEEGVHAGWMLIKSFQSSDDAVDKSAPKGWGWYISQQPLSQDILTHLESLLLKYADQIQALSIMTGGITVGWNEQGVAADLDEFEAWVAELRGLLRSYLLDSIEQINEK